MVRIDKRKAIPARQPARQPASQPASSNLERNSYWMLDGWMDGFYHFRFSHVRWRPQQKHQASTSVGQQRRELLGLFDRK
jgi:hypothetical protein